MKRERRQTILVLSDRFLGKEVSGSYRQLRARRTLSIFKDILLRTRRALMLYTVNGDSALLVLNGTSLKSGSVLLALNWRYLKITMKSISLISFGRQGPLWFFKRVTNSGCIHYTLWVLRRNPMFNPKSPRIEEDIIKLISWNNYYSIIMWYIGHSRHGWLLKNQFCKTCQNVFCLVYYF